MSSDYEKYLWQEAASEDPAERGSAYLHLAEHSLSYREFERAISYNEIAKTSFTEAGDYEGVGETHIQFARILIKQGKHDDALVELEACSLEQRVNTHENKLASIVALEAEVFMAMRDIDRAADCFRNSIALYKNDGETESQIFVARQFARFLTKHNRLDEALAVVEDAESVIHEIDGARLVAELMLQKGRVLVKLDRRDDALEAFESAKVSFEFLDMPAFVDFAKLEMVRAHNRFGEFQAALEICVSVQENLLPHSRSFHVASKLRLRFYYEEAFAKYSLGRLDEAKELAHRCSKISRSYAYLKVETRCLRLLAAIAIDQDDDELAERLLRNALTQNDKLTEPKPCRKIKMQLAMLLVGRGGSQEAITLLESFDIYSWHNGHLQMRQIYFVNLMQAYADLENHDQAVTLAKLVLENALVEGVASLWSANAHEMLAKVYSQRGDHAEAREQGLKALAMAIELNEQEMSQELSKRWLQGQSAA